MALDFVAGCIGGCAGVIAGHPLDTVKVHAQTGSGAQGLLSVRSLFRRDAFTVLYRGVGAPLGAVAGTNALLFGSYGAALRRQPDPESLTAHAIAGAYAGLAQSVVLTPVELVKTRQQLATGVGEGPSAASVARKVLREGGVRALFRGLGVTAVRDAPGLSAYFWAYEALTRGERSAWRVFCAGGAAGAFSWLIVYPADVIKSRLQADETNKYKGAWDCAARTVRAEGWRGLGRGLGATMVRAFVCNGACFTAVSWTIRAADVFEPKSGYRTFLFSVALGDALCASDVAELHADFLAT